MGNVPPEYCHYCGGELNHIEPPTAHRCTNCNEWVFYNPIPTSRVAVLQGDAVLLVKVDDPNHDLWGTPGGMVEAAEDPNVTGARELQEETTLVVDPADLVLFDARSFVKFEETHKNCLAYAVDAGDIMGTLQANDEVAAARFWTAQEFGDSEAELLTSWPHAYQDFTWWVEHAGAALKVDQIS